MARHRARLGHVPRRRYRRDVPGRDRGHRAADPAHRAGAAVPPVRIGARPGFQGGADRRGRRRGVRRLRHHERGEDPPLLRRSAAIDAPAVVAATALSVPAWPEGAVAEISGSLLPRAGETRSAIRCSRICRAFATRRARRCSSRTSCAPSSATTTRSTRCAPACRPTSSAGIRLPRRSTSKRRIFCRAISCLRRVTASPWRTQSKAASRSSTIAWSSSPRASRRN